MSRGGASESRVAARVATVFVVAGALWIAVSDWVSTQLGLSPTQQLWFDFAKGWFFVGLTGALIYVLVLRELRARRSVERRFQNAFTQLPVGLFRAAPTGRLLDVNPALVRMLGFIDRPAMAGRSLANLFVDSAAGARWLERVRSGMPAEREEVALGTRNGEVVWAEINARGVFGEEGDLMAIHGAVEDVTERRRAQERLRDTGEALQAMIQASPHAIVTYDPSGRILGGWNQAARKLFGFSRDEVRGLTDPLVPRSDEELIKAERLLRTVAQGRTVRSLEARRRRKDGSEVDVRISAAPLRESNGTISGVLMLFQDVSRQKELEAQLRQSQKLEAVGQVASGVAHDFNNLLTVIQSSAELVSFALDEADEETRSSMADLQAAVQRGTELVRRLTIFSRSSPDRDDRFDLGDLVGRYVRTIRRVLPESIDVQFTVGDRIPAVEGDAGAVEQILLNLCTNARDAMPAGGLLRIHVYPRLLGAETALQPPVPPGEYVCIAVVDTGTGMDEETLTRVFEPFFTTKPPGEGTGLGLSMVYGLVRQHGGAVEAESQPGQGTAIRIYFPAAGEPIGPEESTGLDAEGSARGEGTILVVEDERSIRKVLQRALTRIGYEVILAGDGTQALEAFQSHPGSIDLVLSDIVMPRMSGPELHQAVQAISLRPVPFLFVTGYTEQRVLEEAEIDSSVPILQKPWSFKELVRTIKTLLEQAPPRPEGTAPPPASPELLPAPTNRLSGSLERS